MAIGYDRQSSFADGDVILAEHGNLEFNKLVDVFDSSGGHNHDGTPGGGAAVPLLEDLSGTYYFRLNATGIDSNVVLDEDDLASNSTKRLATQRSIKKYVDDLKVYTDAADSDLQGQIDVFQNSNHGHLNYEQLTKVGVVVPVTETYVPTYGIHYIVKATVAPVDSQIPLPTIPDQWFTLTNSRSSTQDVQLKNPGVIIYGGIEVDSTTDILLEPGDTLTLITTSTNELEVI